MRFSSAIPEHDRMAFVAIGDRRGDVHDLFAIPSASTSVCSALFRGAN